jgi:histone acetyltransferase (RNA polymerase elongator complex component)
MSAFDFLAGLGKLIEELFKTYRSKRNIPVQTTRKYDQKGNLREESRSYKSRRARK